MEAMTLLSEKNLNLLKIRTNIDCVVCTYSLPQLHMEGNVNYVKYQLTRGLGTGIIIYMTSCYSLLVKEF